MLAWLLLQMEEGMPQGPEDTEPELDGPLDHKGNGADPQTPKQQ